MRGSIFMPRYRKARSVFAEERAREVFFVTVAMKPNIGFLCRKCKPKSLCRVAQTKCSGSRPQYRGPDAWLDLRPRAAVPCSGGNCTTTRCTASVVVGADAADGTISRPSFFKKLWAKSIPVAGGASAVDQDNRPSSASLRAAPPHAARGYTLHVPCSARHGQAATQRDRDGLLARSTGCWP